MSRLMKRLLKRSLRHREGGVIPYKKRMIETARASRELHPEAGRSFRQIANHL